MADPTIGLGRVLGEDVDEATVREHLRGVIDPELGVSIVDLGLVYEAGVSNGVARIVMTTTTPACPIGSYLSDAIERVLFDVPGIIDVRVEVTYEPRWSPELMSDEAKLQLGWSD